MRRVLVLARHVPPFFDRQPARAAAANSSSSMIFATFSRLPAHHKRGWARLAIALAWSVPLPSVTGQGVAAQTGIATYKQMSLTQLMDVEVTSVSRHAEKLLETASAVQIATGGDLRRAGVRSLPDGLRLLSNLQVAQVDARQWAITARGFNNTFTNKMLVLLDGRTLYTPLFAGVFWDVQGTMMDDVERIEAISGPGATQWGSNAVNGVINITTKHTRDTLGGLLVAGVGTELRGLAAARYGGKLAPDLHYRVYARHFRHDGTRLSDGRDAPDDWRKVQGGFRVDWQPRAGDLLTFQGDIYDGRIGQVAPLRDIAVSGGNVLGRLTHRLANASEFKVQAYYDRTFRRIPGSITEELDTFDADFQHHLNVTIRHDLVWGGAVRTIDDRVRNPTTLAFVPPDVQRTWWSGFVQDTMAIVPDRLRVTFGAKAERNPYTGTEFQPSARLAWKPQAEQIVWGAISRAMRTPSRVDREFFQPASPPFVIAGGPGFHSERLLAYELGYRALLGSDVALSLSTYFHDYDGLRSVESTTPATGESMLGNGLDGHSYGAELSLDIRVTPQWRLRFGYTEMRVGVRPEPWSTDRIARGNPSFDPNRQALLHSQLDLPFEAGLDAVLRYVAPIGNQALPGYTEVDLRASWRPNPGLELAVVGRSLLHARHAEFGLPAVRRHIERSVYAEAVWRF